jgi:hypothetical protein
MGLQKRTSHCTKTIPPVEKPMALQKKLIDVQWTQSPVKKGKNGKESHFVNSKSRIVRRTEALHHIPQLKQSDNGSQG